MTNTDGKCLICGCEGSVLPVRDFRGNTFQTVFVCSDCYERRCSHGGTCASCSHYRFTPDLKRVVCEFSGRIVMRADRCGKFEKVGESNEM